MIIRPLSVFERDAVENFFLRLSPPDRRKRFCCALGDATISSYVRGLDFRRDTVLGAFDGEAQLVGVAELVRGGRASEMAFSVRSDRRGRRIGTLLMQKLITRARLCGVRQVYVMFLADNAPMRRMALRAGMTIQTTDGECRAARELAAPSVQELARWVIEEELSHSSYFGVLGIARWRSLLDPRGAAAAHS